MGAVLRDVRRISSARAKRAPESPQRGDLPELTARENAILRLVAQGEGNGEIARKLFISEKTVRNHLTNIFEKLGVDSRARAIVLARDRGAVLTLPNLPEGHVGHLSRARCRIE